MTEPTRYFFVHMQKTAGTALVQRLKLQFDRPAIYPPVEDAGTVRASIDVDVLRQYFGEHRDEIEVVTGHFPLCASEALGVPFRTFTVLRDPVERTLSLLRDQKQRDPSSNNLSFEEIYSNPINFVGLIQNHMVKMLSLETKDLTAVGTMAHIEFEPQHLERAKRNLAERIDVIGLQEHFEEFCTELAQRFEWDLGPPRFANRSKPMEMPAELRERIAHDNALDIELYNYAVQLRAERLGLEPVSDH